MKLIKKLSAIMLTMAMIISCSEDDENFNPGSAPDIPPIESFSIGFNNFQEKSNSGGRQMSQANWGRAAIHVGVWNTILTLNLAIPVAAFKASLTSSPQFDQDRGLWLWNFDYTFLGRNYSSELTAELTSDSVEWQMFISEENGFQNFLWYTGTMNLAGTEGFWFLNRNADDPSTLLTIHWEKEKDVVQRVKYTNAIVGSADNGGFIEYGTQTEEFDRFYNIFTPSTDNTVNIEWNESSGEGRIKDPGFYTDDNYRCWNEDFEDTPCQ